MSETSSGNKSNLQFANSGLDLDFVERLSDFDASNRRSYVKRMLNNPEDAPKVYEHIIDGYLMSKKIFTLDISRSANIYDKMYERNVIMLSHNVETGKVIAFFAGGGHTDFLNLNWETMRRITEYLMETKDTDK